MTIERLGRRGHDSILIDEEVVAVERLIPDEVVDAAFIVFAPALRHDRNQGAAIVAILSCVIVAQHFDFADRILIDSHADLV